jgi:hypothetical protein
MRLGLPLPHTRREFIATSTQSVELLLEGCTSEIETDDLIEIDSLHDFIVKGFSYEFRIGSEDFDIDHKRYVLADTRDYRKMMNFCKKIRHMLLSYYVISL